MKPIISSRDQERVFVLRFDAGVEIIAGLKDFCNKNKITAGQFSGIGSSGDLILSYYNLKTKEYEDKRFEEDLEVLSLSGNIGIWHNSEENNEDVIVHAHGVFSDRAMVTLGGHVKKLIVSATCEIFLRSIPDDSIIRKFDEKTGLRLIADSELR